MEINGLKIPDELKNLIDSGWWPTKHNVQNQNLKCLVTIENIKRISVFDDQIYFSPPPFRILSENVKDNPTFWKNPFAAIHEIDINKAIDIGDFGLGSDSPILLDYRKSEIEPSVIFLKYDNESTYWKQCATTFREFMDILGIKHI